MIKKKLGDASNKIYNKKDRKYNKNKSRKIIN